ncbi:type II toxin-antitoxin system mRNA interferase toxin, RelE/StbE family [Candidatus Pacearchaeota archaeon]|nr:type II toxin-antitoxin system mRNA interferase toxin, RelE/StbE family [Candidatus Pacearchaeota archaeon]
MYKLFTANSKAEKSLRKYIKLQSNIKNKLDKLKENPKRTIGAHPLHGKLKGKWACWLGSNIRAIYIINEKEKSIIIQAIGTHKIY